MKQRDQLHALAMEKRSRILKYLHLQHCWKVRSRSVALSQDLHDGLGGLLSGTKLQLSYLDPHQSETIEDGISKSIKQIDGAVEELRRVAHTI